MRGNWKKVMLALAAAAVLASMAALVCCALFMQSGSSGWGPRSGMSDEDASADCLEEFAALVVASDADGLVAAFSEAAREQDAGLASDAEELMGIIGGGTLSDGHFTSSTRVYPSGYNRIESVAIVTAPDGSEWRAHIIDCTYNGDDPEQVGLRSIEVIPVTGEFAPRGAPQGFGFYDGSDDWPYGIRLITSWEGWDPLTSPYSPDW